jgi:hypothetical protein
MKQVIYLIMVAALVCGCKKKEKEQEPGSIYGVITDKATGEPVRTAGVQLNTGTKTVTGNEGQYEFTDLKAGEYTITVTKTGYTELVGYKITVEAGKTNKGDVQIEKLPMALRIVNDKGQNMDTLAFGNDESLVTRSFNIFNDSPESLEWIITENCDWITELSKSSGTLQAGKQQPIVLTIDREKLGAGDNVYILNISSDNGTKELTVTATGSERGLAALNTLAVSNIAANTATFNGIITATGAPAYTERGFVYSTSSMPTIENTVSKLTAAVTGNATYSVHAIELILNKRYYVRAYAINSVGIAYSTNEADFTTKAIMPTLTTQEVTNINIANETATFNGTIGTIGDPAYTERGFVYGTTHNPTIADIKKVAQGTGAGAYSLGITEIQEGKTYYVRAYATNAGGTVYGNEVSFITIARMPEVSTQAASNINIDAGTVTCEGTIITVGDPVYTERGFVYATIHNPTVDDDAKKIASGTGTGAFFSNITGLTEGNIYYVRAYATNSKGTAYGNEISIDFNGTLPTLSTQTATNQSITNGSLTFNGTIIIVGVPAYTERGFVYGTMHNPTVNSDVKKIVPGSGTGDFFSNITGLTEGNIYYVRAYATNSRGTAYGNEVSADFNAVMPAITTQAVSDIDVTSARLNGAITDVGDPAYTVRGFVYGTMHNPTIGNDIVKQVSGTGTGAFFTDLTGLTKGTTYYVRAYATNSKGTVYGQEVSFVPVSPYYVELPVDGLMVQKIDIGIGYCPNINSLCDNSSVAGYTDWRLPTKDELAVLYNNKTVIGGFMNSCYWSSTVYSVGNYWYQDFSSGAQSNSHPSYCRGRCVRNITP